MIAAIYARKSTDQNVADEEKIWLGDRRDTILRAANEARFLSVN